MTDLSRINQLTRGLALATGGGINLTKPRLGTDGRVSITAIIQPDLGPLVTGDTIASALSADIDQTTNYASTAGTIASVMVEVLVNGVAPPDLDTPLDFEDVVSVTVTVTDSKANVRVFTLGRTVGAVVPDAFGVADWGISVAPAFDPDALAYITAVETADGEALEAGVKDAINDFVVGCKDDAIWDALKATCILAGARTLNGCLVPLTGTAPTNFNFVTADYNRKTGLKGNGSTKYLDSNRAQNADPQNSAHLSTYVSERLNDDSIVIGGFTSTNSISQILSSPSSGMNLALNHSGIGIQIAGAAAATGFIGVTRPTSSSITGRVSGLNTILGRTSTVPSGASIFVFARNFGGLSAPTAARVQFYSIGENLDLAALDTRVSALMTAIDGAIA